MTEDKPGLQGYDKEQVQMMEENCIVVDKDDNIIGPDTKVNCHLGEGNCIVPSVFCSSTRQVNY